MGRSPVIALQDIIAERNGNVDYRVAYLVSTCKKEAAWFEHPVLQVMSISRELLYCQNCCWIQTMLLFVTWVLSNPSSDRQEVGGMKTLSAAEAR